MQYIVLLVDDNSINLMVEQAMLKKMGHTVVAATNGEEALRAMDEQEFDVVLMDIQMPLMDGVDTTRAIREREAHSGNHTPIIAVTAHTSAIEKERYISSGMDGYVAKPVDFDRLSSEMKRVSTLKKRAAS